MPEMQLITWTIPFVHIQQPLCRRGARWGQLLDPGLSIASGSSCLPERQKTAELLKSAILPFLQGIADGLQLLQVLQLQTLDIRRADIQLLLEIGGDRTVIFFNLGECKHQVGCAVLGHQG